MKRLLSVALSTGAVARRSALSVSENQLACSPVDCNVWVGDHESFILECSVVDHGKDLLGHVPKGGTCWGVVAPGCSVKICCRSDEIASDFIEV